MDKKQIITGDNTGGNNTYVWKGKDGLVSSSSPSDVLLLQKKQGGLPKINKKAISFLLHNSLVPTPMSVYEGVSVLGVGDYLTFTPESTEGEFGTDYPYWQKKSTGKSEPSTKLLLEHLTASVSNKIKSFREEEGAKQAVLMLSSGKDSTAIAIAIKEAGLEEAVHSYTYTDAESGYVEEAHDAARFAKKLGLSHETITVPSDPHPVREALLHFFKSAPYPSCDPTTIPYVVGLYHAGIRDTAILDGTRSDMCMGMFPGKTYEKLCKYYDMIGGGWKGFESICSMVPFYHKAVKFVSSWPEIIFYHHGHLRELETRRFFDDTINTRERWMDIYNEHKHRPIVDRYSYTNDQYFAGGGIVPKIKMTAEALSCQSIMPWSDEALIEYYFNLPQEYKYDLKNKKNKVLLRELLAEYLDYDAEKTGKRIFYFNMGKFVEDNKEFIRDEVLSCQLWNQNIERELERYFSINEKHPRAGGAIIDLFMISGWANHCRYLKG